MKIRPVGAELFHTDRQTGGQTDGQTYSQAGREASRQANGQADMTTLTVALSNFSKAPNKVL
jgi:hypothetical protein